VLLVAALEKVGTGVEFKKKLFLHHMSSTHQQFISRS